MKTGLSLTLGALAGSVVTAIAAIAIAGGLFLNDRLAMVQRIQYAGEFSEQPGYDIPFACDAVRFTTFTMDAVWVDGRSVVPFNHGGYLSVVRRNSSTFTIVTGGDWGINFGGSGYTAPDPKRRATQACSTGAATRGYDLIKTSRLLKLD